VFEYFHNKKPSKYASIVWEHENKLIVEMHARIPVLLSHDHFIEKYYCGYVELNKCLFNNNRGYFDFDRFREDIDVYGGCTFMVDTGDTIIFGFDCAHVFDYMNPKNIDFVKNEIYKREKSIYELLKYINN
jgi:hypothetical protein